MPLKYVPAGLIDNTSLGAWQVTSHHLSQVFCFSESMLTKMSLGHNEKITHNIAILTRFSTSKIVVQQCKQQVYGIYLGVIFWKSKKIRNSVNYSIAIQ